MPRRVMIPAPEDDPMPTIPFVDAEECGPCTLAQGFYVVAHRDGPRGPMAGPYGTRNEAYVAQVHFPAGGTAILHVNQDGYRW